MGTDLQVVDAKTGEDMTRVTLTQIIVEDAKGQPTGLPLELLRQLIVASDRVGQEFIMWYLKSAFDAYQNVQSTVQSRLSEVQSAALSPLHMVKNLVQGATKENPAEPAGELQDLRKRISDWKAARKNQNAGKSKFRKSVADGHLHWRGFCHNASSLFYSSVHLTTFRSRLTIR